MGKGERESGRGKRRERGEEEKRGGQGKGEKRGGKIFSPNLNLNRPNLRDRKNNIKIT